MIHPLPTPHPPTHGSLKIWTPPIWDPFGHYAERAGQRTEQQEMFESGNAGSSHPSAPHAIPCPGTCFLGSDAPCKSPSKVWQHPHSIPLTPSPAPRKDGAKFSPKRILSEPCWEGLGKVSAPGESWRWFISPRQLAARSSDGSKAGGESLGLILNPLPCTQLRLGECAWAPCAH